MGQRVVIVACCLMITVATLVCATPPAEIEALRDLYKTTNGPQWSRSKNWLQGDPCSTTKPWYGIKCASGHVSQLLLQDNNLGGFLPASIGNLTQLTVMSLDVFNHIGGHLPTTIGRLKQVFVLTMAGCDLEGAIPAEICGMTSLSILHLGQNKLTSIPECLGNLRLSSCGLSMNPFKCPIPPFSKSECGATCNS